MITVSRHWGNEVKHVRRRTGAKIRDGIKKGGRAVRNDLGYDLDLMWLRFRHIVARNDLSVTVTLRIKI